MLNTHYYCVKQLQYVYMKTDQSLRRDRLNLQTNSASDLKLHLSTFCHIWTEEQAENTDILAC